jgi:serine/threonine protein kinase
MCNYTLVRKLEQGVLRNGETIAVKRIVSSLMPGQQKQFESEVYHLMMLKHPNIVRCVGYCYEIQNACLEYNGRYVFAETAERLLCMEYMPKGSLDTYLSGCFSVSASFEIVVRQFRETLSITFVLEWSSYGFKCR